MMQLHAISREGPDWTNAQKSMIIRFLHRRPGAQVRYSIPRGQFYYYRGRPWFGDDVGTWDRVSNWEFGNKPPYTSQFYLRKFDPNKIELIYY